MRSIHDRHSFFSLPVRRTSPQLPEESNVLVVGATRSFKTVCTATEAFERLPHCRMAWAMHQIATATGLDPCSCRTRIRSCERRREGGSAWPCIPRIDFAGRHHIAEAASRRMELGAPKRPGSDPPSRRVTYQLWVARICTPFWALPECWRAKDPPPVSSTESTTSINSADGHSESRGQQTVAYPRNRKNFIQRNGGADSEDEVPGPDSRGEEH